MLLGFEKLHGTAHEEFPWRFSSSALTGPTWRTPIGAFLGWLIERFRL